MNDKLISIIIPVYNVEKYLGECLDSILLQTYKNFEVILVDDNSTDSSFKICNEYAQKDNRIKVFHHQENSGGCGLPRNTGLKHISGDYVTFIDSDDLIEKNYLEELVKISDKDNIIAAEFYYIGTKERKHKQKVKCYPNSTIMKNYFKNKYFIPAWGKLIPKEFVKDLVFPSIFLEDIPSVYKVLLKAKNVKYISSTYYIYRKRENSLTTNKNIQHFFPILDELTKIEKELKENKVSRSTLNSFYNYYTKFLLSFFRYSYKGKNDKLVNERINKVKHQLRRNFFNYFFRVSFKVKSGLFIFALSPSLFYHINYVRLWFKKKVFRLPDVQL